MKKKILLPLFVAAFLVGMSSCEKEDHHGTRSNCGFDEQDNEVAMTPEEFEAGIIDAFDEMEVQGGDEILAFFMDNEGIPAFLEMEPFNVDGLTEKKEGPCRLSGKNELTAKQKEALKKAWENYMHCRKESAAKQRAHYAALRAKIEKQREELIHLRKAEKISEEQFKERMAKLRAQFKEAMKGHGHDHQAIMRKCYKSYLEHVRSTLHKEQYAIWMRCHKAHLPHKKHHDPKKREHEKERK